ncbi:nickel pincer cofactor biosynthesis protein LarC [Pseudobutyrivibrio xylanivorans]|uniref:Pyridinium-3,5-bisthiocarboxylic acid mononucleotide nickel insertion protein n=1 Tax=Pseudobutyrivibrio xylanivorans TaxID=185007 RepID=A0A5P6VNP5_PSEXY|nr:nickel pincer cofactor biosynthesis protein LarC [Pseudobutyrivibrio xylanivorans]QFJ54293.1 nickel pincer cofactor biosynthesis protein LarC [Pseudobutyrivibrio xylanivorans]
MKTLYIECKMGAAGDMLTAALLDLFDDKSSILSELNSIGIPHVSFNAETTEKCGINGTRMLVKVDGQEEGSSLSSHIHSDHHTHNSLPNIKALILGLNAPDKVKSDAIEVYKSLAMAESKVHGTPIDDIHFHEVGTFDAIADIVAVCYLLYKIHADHILVSPIHVGSGTVHCEHGILPVPAPATAELLKGVPIYGGSIESELCTPTGAALLRYFASSFNDFPVMITEICGYGMGKKDFPVANCLRIFIGDSLNSKDQVFELNCNIDDITGEDLGYAMDAIYEAGAREVFFTHVQMKKNRPGILLTVLVDSEQKDSVVKSIFSNTTTIGIREKICERYVLDREIKTIKTPLGDVQVKKSYGYGTTHIKAEFDNLINISKENGMSLANVRAEIAKYL